MKKLIFSLTVMTFFTVENVFADWSNAKYFQCAVTKRYTARAKLKPPSQNIYSWTYDGGCAYAQINGNWVLMAFGIPDANVNGTLYHVRINQGY